MIAASAPAARSSPLPPPSSSPVVVVGVVPLVILVVVVLVPLVTLVVVVGVVPLVILVAVVVVGVVVLLPVVVVDGAEQKKEGHGEQSSQKGSTPLSFLTKKEKSAPSVTLMRGSSMQTVISLQLVFVKNTSKELWVLKAHPVKLTFGEKVAPEQLTNVMVSNALVQSRNCDWTRGIKESNSDCCVNVYVMQVKSGMIASSTSSTQSHNAGGPGPAPVVTVPPPVVTTPCAVVIGRPVVEAVVLLPVVVNSASQKKNA